MIYQKHYKKDEPKRGQDLVAKELYICYVPEWCHDEFVVAYWSGNFFRTEGYSIDVDEYVVSWSKFSTRTQDV